MNTTHLSLYVPRPVLLPASPYVTSNKAKVAKSFTTSYRHNRRGIENLAYSLYSTIFEELTGGMDSLVPQVNASIALEYWGDELGRPPPDKDYEPEFVGESEEDDDVEMSRVDEQELLQEITELQAEAEMDIEVFRAGYQPSVTSGQRRVSGASTVASTLSDQSDSDYLKEFFPDLMIRHARIDSMPLPHPKRLPPNHSLYREQVHFMQRLGVQVKVLIPALVGEVKRGPSRAFAPICKEFKRFLRRQMTYAVDQLMLYAAAVFTEYGGLKRIAGLVAAGVYWSWAVIRADEVPQRDWQEEENIFLTGQANLRERRHAFGEKFSRIYEVGTPESDEAFTRLRDTFLYAVAASNGDFAFDF